jgi:hypothetical protein
MKVKQVIFFLLLFSIKRSNLELHYDQFQFLDFIFTWNSGVACASLCQIIFFCGIRASLYFTNKVIIYIICLMFDESTCNLCHSFVRLRVSY